MGRLGHESVLVGEYGKYIGLRFPDAHLCVPFQMGKKEGLADLIFSTKDNVTVDTTEGKLTLPGLGLNIARYAFHLHV